ncbi:MAG: hypothetical protein JO132_20850, partial [Streptosporangiaceae bacterium]|nr:hypothetical protein [Streptosporangiaceae bacterium]
MFALTCRQARRAVRTPLLAAAALVIAVPGLLVSACSGQAAGGRGVGGTAGPEAATQA